MAIKKSTNVTILTCVPCGHCGHRGRRVQFHAESELEIEVESVTMDASVILDVSVNQMRAVTVTQNVSVNTGDHGKVGIFVPLHVEMEFDNVTDLA